MAKLSFDARKVAPQQAFDTIPAGWYLLAITASSLKPTKGVGGEMLELEFTVQAGEFKGRKVFDRLNIKNKSAKAQEIGQQQLSAICHATGVVKVDDSAELHNKPFQGKVGLEAARFDEETKTNYEARNTYRGCKAPEGASVAAATTDTPKWAPGADKKGAPTPPTSKAPTPPPVKAPEVTPDERQFFVFVDPDTHEKSGDEIREMLAEGMPAETPVVLQAESDKGWKTVGDYGLDKPNVVEAAPAKETPPPPAAAKKVAPWLKKK